MTKEQIRELTAVLNGKKYTKRWDFWASLARQDIVKIHSKPAPHCGVESIEITDWGKIVLSHEAHKED
ncbi:MAG: hypothetical protein WC554_06075 [Clostridia bacterium]|jgi:hypothetical protein